MTNIPAGMVPYGPEHPDYPNEPGDWDGGPVFHRDQIWALPRLTMQAWVHCPSPGRAIPGVDIVAYTPRPAAMPREQCAKAMAAAIEKWRDGEMIGDHDYYFEHGFQAGWFGARGLEPPE